MARRRAFSTAIVRSDAFVTMPLSAQALYFHLGMEADDEGFVNNPKIVQRMVGAAEDDLRLLIAKHFLLAFDSGVVVIKHWRMSNYLRPDRFHASQYTEERSLLYVKENGSYTFDASQGTPLLECGHDNDTATAYQSRDNDMALAGPTKPNLTKLNLTKPIKNNGEVKRFVAPSVEEVTAYIREKGYHFDAESFVAFYESKGWKVGSQPMKSWRAACVTWEKRHKGEGVKEHDFGEYTDLF